MNKREMTGCSKVFGFTLVQMLKSSALRGTLIFMVLVSFLGYPVVQLVQKLSSGEKEITPTTVEKLLVIDESGLNFVDWFDFETAGLDARQIPPMVKEERDFETVQEALKEEQGGVALLRIRRVAEEGGYYYTFIRGAKSTVEESDLNLLSDAITSGLNEQLTVQLDVSKEQLALLTMSVESETVYTAMDEVKEPSDDEKKPSKDMLSGAEYSICLGVLCFVIMLVSMCGEYIASTIVMEKSSKVVEYLLTSVRPLALLIGKILAILVILFGQIFLMMATYAVSVIGYGMLFEQKSFADSASIVFGIFEALGGLEINVMTLGVSILLLLGGILVYSLISGIISASVNNVEELQENLKTFTMFLMVGAYGSMAVIIMDMAMGSTPAVVSYIAYLLPITSVFIVPGYLLIGRVELWIGVVAFVITAVAVVLMFLFAARIYEYLMYYRGEKLHLKDYFKIYKNEKGGTSHE